MSPAAIQTDERPLGQSIYPAAQFMTEREKVWERGVESGGGSLPHGLFNKKLYFLYQGPVDVDGCGCNYRWAWPLMRTRWGGCGPQ